MLIVLLCFVMISSDLVCCALVWLGLVWLLGLLCFVMFVLCVYFVLFVCVLCVFCLCCFVVWLLLCDSVCCFYDKLTDCGLQVPGPSITGGGPYGLLFKMLSP